MEFYICAEILIFLLKPSKLTILTEVSIILYQEIFRLGYVVSVMIALEVPRELASIKWIHVFVPRFSYYNENSTKTVTFLQSNVMSSYFEPVTEDGSSQFLNQQVQGEEIPTKAFCRERKIWELRYWSTQFYSQGQGTIVIFVLPVPAANKACKQQQTELKHAANLPLIHDQILKERQIWINNIHLGCGQ